MSSVVVCKRRQPPLTQTPPLVVLRPVIDLSGVSHTAADNWPHMVSWAGRELSLAPRQPEIHTHELAGKSAV